MYNQEWAYSFACVMVLARGGHWKQRHTSIDKITSPHISKELNLLYSRICKQGGKIIVKTT